MTWGQDFTFPLPVGFQRDIFLGHEQTGEGGGIPVAYVWNQQHGLALMHIETKPKDWYMPVASQHGQVTLAFEQCRPSTLPPSGRGRIFESV